MKKTKGSIIKEMLIVYLTFSKVLYWIDTVSAIEGDDLGSVGRAVIERLIGRDIIIILGIIFFYILESFISKKAKADNISKEVLIYVIGYIGLIGIFYAYMLILSFFHSIQFPTPWQLVSDSIIGYAVAMVIINIKFYFKEKEKKKYIESNNKA